MDTPRLDRYVVEEARFTAGVLHEFGLSTKTFEGAHARFAHRNFRITKAENPDRCSIGDLVVFFDKDDSSKHFFARVDKVDEGVIYCAAVTDFDVVGC